MAQAKLTLRLNKELIKRAKLVAEKAGKSVSQMVADYFLLFEKDTIPSSVDFPPITRSLKGALRSKRVNKKDYHRYLVDKYL